MVGVIEIQPHRLKVHGECGFHLHLVFQGVCPNGSYAVSVADSDSLWEKSVSNYLGYSLKMPVACNIRHVSKRTKGDLAKYVSKGKKIVDELIAAGFEKLIPSRWWTCSLALRNAVKAGTVVIRECGEPLRRMMTAEPHVWYIWHKDIAVELPGAYTWICATVGQLTRYGCQQARKLAALENSYLSPAN